MDPFLARWIPVFIFAGIVGLAGLVLKIVVVRGRK
jgi:hypothetical protein